MRVLGIVMVTCLAASAETTPNLAPGAAERMNTGDVLCFEIADLGLPGPVESLWFQFVSEPFDSAARFEAELRSDDGIAAVAFPDVQTSGGAFAGGAYSGPISSISSWAALPDGTFKDGRAILVLRNIGPPVNVGLPGYELHQDLWVALTSGPLAGGGVTAWRPRDLPPATAPESGSGVLVAAAGVLLCVVSRGLKLFSWTRI